MTETNNIMSGASAEATVQGTVGTHMTKTVDGVTTVTGKPDMNKPTTSKKLANIAWSNAPLDTFLRHIGKAKTNSDTYQFYSVTARGVSCTATGTIGAGAKNVGITVNAGIHCLSASGVLVIPTMHIDAEGNIKTVTAAKNPVRLRINKVNYGSNTIYVTPLNVKNKAIELSNTILYRSGVACDQHIAKTEDPQAVPTKDANTCQRFLYTVSENMYQRMQEKDVEYGLNDYKDQALYDFRLDTEKAILFGGGASDGENFVDAESNRRVLHMRGLLDFDIQTIDRDEEEVDTFLNEVMQKMFAVNNGSRERLMFYGAEFGTMLANCKWWQKQMEANNTKIEWGVEWDIIRSNFGVIRAVYDPALSLTGPYSNCAFIVDPAHIRVVEQVPLTERKLDLQKAGISNTNDIVLEESITLEVTNPMSHGFITM